jgi:hypothetical protein
MHRRGVRGVPGLLHLSPDRGGEPAPSCLTGFTSIRKHEKKSLFARPVLHCPPLSWPQMVPCSQNEEYYKRIPEPIEDELDMLDLAFGLTET